MGPGRKDHSHLIKGTRVHKFLIFDDEDVLRVGFREKLDV
jgi:hypothetical protein